jgi:hypothetical protein
VLSHGRIDGRHGAPKEVTFFWFYLNMGKKERN